MSQDGTIFILRNHNDAKSLAGCVGFGIVSFIL